MLYRTADAIDRDHFVHMLPQHTLRRLMTYRVVHRTDYTYDSEVSSSYGELYLLPRDVPGQVCRSCEVRIEPGPHDYRRREDFYGNRVAYFAVVEPHTRLTVTAESVVDVDRPASVPLAADQPWEMVRDRLRLDASDDAFVARGFLLGSPKVEMSPAVAAYGAVSFPAGRSLIEAITDLTARIHADFAYAPGATSVRTTLTQLLEQRKGVCQDFAHLAVGCLRSLGLAGRYVSGYLDTASPAGKERVVGADVSHAWPSVFVPDAGWVDFDPTNDRLVSDRYVTNAYGRDYGDVSPLKGVIYTESKRSELHVSVDVAPVETPNLMRVKVGCEFDYSSLGPAPTIWQVRPRPTRPRAWISESWGTSPPLPWTSYHDLYGNVCDRITLPPGRTVLRYDANFEVSGAKDDVGPQARQVPIESLPDETMVFLLPEPLLLIRRAPGPGLGAVRRHGAGVVKGCRRMRLGAREPPVPAGASTPVTSALDVWQSRTGVCRDFAHLGLTLCRSLNIPARYVFGYLPDVDVPEPYEPMDFCAWFEAYLEDRWWTFDPRNNVPRAGRVVIGRGRDALDVAMVTTYGAPVLQSMTVWADQAGG